MLITKHLALLNKINRRLGKLNLHNKADKSLIDDMLTIISVDSKMIDEQLLKDKDIEDINLYRKVIQELQDRKFIIESIDCNNIFEGIITFYDSIWQLKMKEITPYRERYNIANGKLESGCMKFDDNSPEMVERRKEYEIAKKEYAALKLQIDKSYDDYRKKISELSYLISFKSDMFNEKLIELKYVMDNIFYGKITSQDIFINPHKDLSKTYEILVENKMIEYIDYLEFNLIITLNKEFNFTKVKGGKGKDKYIAYFINCLIKYDFLNHKRAKEWENYMIEKFYIKHYSKKNNPSEKSKESLHKEIDRILGIEFIKASNKFNE